VSELEQNLSEEGQARRRFLKQAATVAWASPVLVTMMSRAAHATHITVCGQAQVGGGCLTTAACGSTSACLPDPENPGVGEDCLCQALPS
jgi:hypothetical protein